MGDHAHNVSKTSHLWRERKASAVACKLANDRLASFTSEGHAMIKASELEDAILQGGGRDQWVVISKTSYCSGGKLYSGASGASGGSGAAGLPLECSGGSGAVNLPPEPSGGLSLLLTTPECSGVL